MYVVGVTSINFFGNCFLVVNCLGGRRELKLSEGDGVVGVSNELYMTMIYHSFP